MSNLHNIISIIYECISELHKCIIKLGIQSNRNTYMSNINKTILITGKYISKLYIYKWILELNKLL